MISLVLALSLAADPALARQLEQALATARERVQARPAAVESAAASPVAASPIDVVRPALAPKPRLAAEPLTLKADEGVSTTWLAGVILLAAAAAAAYWRSRKRLALPLALRIIQHTGLGKGRDLVVVEHDGRRMLLAVTSNSISVLQNAPVEAMHEASERAPRGVAAFEHELRRAVEQPQHEHGRDHGSRLDDALARGRDALLSEPRSEGEALRRKLGRVA